MTETTPSLLNNVITIDDERIKSHLERVVRGHYPPISAPPPLAITNVASMKHSSSSNAPLSRSWFATSVSSRRKNSSRHQA
jgi:hypothetical protein